MFWYIEGDILAIDGIMLTVRVTGTGLGFDVLVSPSVLSWLDQKEKISLWLHHHITDVSESLFGFSSQEERTLFRNLNKVNGIGGKTALALLGLGEETLILAIQMEDDRLLSSVPGIGKKTAQKIIVDLKGSIDFSKKSTGKHPSIPAFQHSDTLLISSLVSMGYDKTRVESIVGEIDKNGTIEARTIEAIRQLAK
jgi:holliday junction DNA helicase RuvA